MTTLSISVTSALAMAIKMKRMLSQGTLVFRFTSFKGVAILSTGNVEDNREFDFLTLGSRKGFDDLLKSTSTPCKYPFESLLA